MRFALIAVVILTFVGCAREATRPLPTAPSPSVATTPNPSIPAVPDPPALPPAPPPPPAVPPALTFVWVVVFEGGGSGLCIPEATVEIVRGQGLGRRLTQSTLRCDTWDPDGVIFDGLNEGDALTLRASAWGYAAKETTVVPTPGGQTAISIVLSKFQ
jgi:hypothetical protein